MEKHREKVKQCVLLTEAGKIENDRIVEQLKEATDHEATVDAQLASLKKY